MPQPLIYLSLCTRSRAATPRGYATLFAVATDFKSAAAHEQSDNENQATRIHVEIEVSHFAAATTQEQDYK